MKGTVTAPLPEVRMKPTRPFEVVGCDFAGPIYLQNKSCSFRINVRNGSSRVQSFSSKIHES